MMIFSIIIAINIGLNIIDIVIILVGFLMGAIA